MLQITNYLKAYNGTTIVKIDTLQLPKGMYWLQGQNGSGKSTFLKSIAGLIPCKGNIVLHNTSLQKQPIAYKQQISYQAAEAMLPPFLTGQNIIDYYKYIKKDDTTKTNFVIENLGIKNFINNKIGTYSSGMQKKVSLALAFIGNNSLILLDEPLTTLDTESSNNFIQLIQYFATQGTSFIITSHQHFEYSNLKFNNYLLVQNNNLIIQ